MPPYRSCLFRKILKLCNFKKTYPLSVSTRRKEQTQPILRFAAENGLLGIRTNTRLGYGTASCTSLIYDLSPLELTKTGEYLFVFYCVLRLFELLRFFSHLNYLRYYFFIPLTLHHSIINKSLCSASLCFSIRSKIILPFIISDY